MIFDLNNRVVKTIMLIAETDIITIDSAIMPSGMYLYSLINNGTEIITKKMIVK